MKQLQSPALADESIVIAIERTISRTISGMRRPLSKFRVEEHCCSSD